MLEYIVTPVSGEPDWEQVPTLSVSNIQWVPDAGIRMTAQICYHQDALFIRQKAVERHIRAELTEPLSMVCDDSCMEFFICPDSDSDRYLNFEVNPNGCLFFGLCTGPDFIARQILEDPKAVFDIQTNLTEDGWELRYRIPISVLRLYTPSLTLEPGRVFRANCYKCGDMTPQPHFLTWNYVAADTPTFHSPADFGKLILGPV